MQYDVIIIGTGSAGFPAGMYASRYGLKNLIIGSQFGGALSTSHKVENYPGFLSDSGKNIMNNFKEHALSSGSELLQEIVSEIKKQDDLFYIKTSTNKEFITKSIILATGNSHRHLGCKGEKEFLGKGVSYCATCDGMFFKNREVVIVGGGNTALTEALYLSDICKKVTIIHRSNQFKAEKVWVSEAEKRQNINFIFNEEIIEIKGNIFLEELLLKSGKIIKTNGLFVAIGFSPNNNLAIDLGIEIDKEGYILVDKRQETSLKGFYSAGDITTNSNKFKQTIMSAAEGCLAANSVHEDLLSR